MTTETLVNPNISASAMQKKLERMAPSIVQPTDVLRVFKCTLKYCKYVFRNGMVAEFINHFYYTKREEQIVELETEIAAGHPHIFIDMNMIEIVAEDRDPNIASRKRIRAELIAEGWTKVNPSNDMGKSEQGKLTPANTSNIASVASGGDAASGAKLAALTDALAKVAK